MPHSDPEAPASDPTDLTWLLSQAAQYMRSELDTVARAEGLAGLRDWIVLTALMTGEDRTQLQLGRLLGVDKTTLTVLLDRLQDDGLIIRDTAPGDRRARVPRITKDGRSVQARVVASRDATEKRLLDGFSKTEQDVLRTLLGRLAAARGGACEPYE